MAQDLGRSEAVKGGGESERPLFDALLTPHRSLGPRGFLILMSCVTGFSFCAGLFFFLVGAWPVVGFLGLDVLAIYLAFKASYRAARMYETLHLTRNSLEVTRVNHWGDSQSWSFQPHWLRVEIAEDPESDSPLTLSSHGSRVEIGRFLSPAERLDLARALRSALAELRGQPA